MDFYLPICKKGVICEVVQLHEVLEMETICKIFLVECPNEVSMHCPTCEKLRVKGTWFVAIKISGHIYLIAEKTAFTCCNEKETTIQVFTSKEDAEMLQEEVRTQLTKDRAIKNLNLVEFDLQEPAMVLH